MNMMIICGAVVVVQLRWYNRDGRWCNRICLYMWCNRGGAAVVVQPYLFIYVVQPRWCSRGSATVFVYICGATEVVQPW